MPFFRFTLVCCAIFTAAVASAGPKGGLGRFWRARARGCAPDLSPAPAPGLPYLDLLRPGRTHEGDVMIDRTEVGEWRTERFARMTYEVFGGSAALADQVAKLAAAAVTYLRYGGLLDDAALTLTINGNLRLDLPVGVASTAFVLMLEQRLRAASAPVQDLTGEEGKLVRRWLRIQPIDLDSLYGAAPAVTMDQAVREFYRRAVDEADLPKDFVRDPKVHASRVFFASLGPWVLIDGRWVATHDGARVSVDLSRERITVETFGHVDDLLFIREVLVRMIARGDAIDDVIAASLPTGLRLELPFDRRGLGALVTLKARLIQGEIRAFKITPDLAAAELGAESAYAAWSRRNHLTFTEVLIPRDAAE